MLSAGRPDAGSDGGGGGRGDEPYRALLERSAEIVWLTDAKGEAQNDLPAWRAFTGQSYEAARGLGWMSAIHPDDRDRAVSSWKRAGHARTTCEVEYRLLRHDGLWRDMHVRTMPILEDDGRLRGFIGTCEDITARKQAEAAIREAARKCEEDRAELEAVFEAMNDTVVVFDMAGQIVFVNKPEGKIFGLPPDGGIGGEAGGAQPDPLAGGTLATPSHPVDLRYPDGSPVPSADWPSIRALRGESVTGLELTAKSLVSGDESWLSVNAAPVRNRDGDQILALLVIRDVTGQHRAAEELREADRRKNDFLSTLSHELRNPLAPIRNSLFLVEHAPPGSPRAKHALEVIRRQTEQLARLVDDLLDVTRIARGKVVLEREQIDLREVVQATCEDHRSLIAKGDVELGISLPIEPVWVSADRTRMAQVIGNLLQNAVKFTPAGGHIDARVKVRGRWAEIAIADTGAGIAPADLERVFAPFAQADQSQARTTGGLGLGLALVKGLAEIHGGSARAHSEGLGTGSEFVVALPILQ